jgi:hypothetical protein
VSERPLGLERERVRITFGYVYSRAVQIKDGNKRRLV